MKNILHNKSLSLTQIRKYTYNSKNEQINEIIVWDFNFTEKK